MALATGFGKRENREMVPVRDSPIMIHVELQALQRPLGLLPLATALQGKQTEDALRTQWNYAGLANDVGSQLPGHAALAVEDLGRRGRGEPCLPREGAQGESWILHARFVQCLGEQ